MTSRRRSRTAGADVPASVQGIVSRCLAKEPDARYPSAREVERALNEARDGLAHKPAPAWRRPAVLIPAALLLLVAATFGTWQTVQARRLRWVQQEAVPEIERLQGSDSTLGALLLAKAGRTVRARRDPPYSLALVSDQSRNGSGRGKCRSSKLPRFHGSLGTARRDALSQSVLAIRFLSCPHFQGGVCTGRDHDGVGEPSGRDTGTRGFCTGAHGAGHGAWRQLWRRGRADRTSAGLLDRQVRSDERGVQEVRRGRWLS